MGKRQSTGLTAKLLAVWLLVASFVHDLPFDQKYRNINSRPGAYFSLLRALSA